jgi:hypothetical protein
MNNTHEMPRDDSMNLQPKPLQKVEKNTEKVYREQKIR